MSSWRKIAYVALLWPAAASFVMGLGTMTGVTYGATEKLSLLFVGSGLATSIMAAACMADAAENNRFGSDAYTVLNTAFMLTGVGGIAALGFAVRSGIKELGWATYKSKYLLHGTNLTILATLGWLLYACEAYGQQVTAEKSGILQVFDNLVGWAKAVVVM